MPGAVLVHGKMAPVDLLDLPDHMAPLNLLAPLPACP